MAKLYYAIAAFAAVAVLYTIITAYGNSRYEAGRLYAEKICEVDKHNAVQEAEYNRYKDNIGVRRLSMDDVVSLLSKRGELRD